MSQHSKIITYVGTYGRPYLSKCTKCDRSFKMYEEVFTKMASKRKKRYCIPCAKAVNLL